MPIAPYHPRRLAAASSLILALGLLAACAGPARPAVPTATVAAPATSAPVATVPANTNTAVPASTQPVVVSAAGDIAAAVDQYRGLLGDNNGGGPGAKPTGRREIN